MGKTPILSIAFIAILAASHVQAQTSFGLRIGGNASQIVGAVPVMSPPQWITGVDPVFKGGFQFGPVVEFRFSDMVAIQPAVLFNLIGGEFNIHSENITNTATWNTSYLQVPLDLMLTFGWFSIHAGGYFGYGLRAMANYSFLRNRVDLFDSIGNGGWGMARTDFGVRGGIGFNFGNSQFSITYSFGFAQLFNPDDFQGIIPNHRSISATNHAISITATHFFRRELEL